MIINDDEIIVGHSQKQIFELCTSKETITEYF